MITNRQEGRFWREGNILHHDCGDDYLAVPLSKLMELNTFQRLILLHVSYNPIIFLKREKERKNGSKRMPNK